MSIDRRSRIARLWSNAELRRLGPLFTGTVVNVSAARDWDKDGGYYVDYFPNAASYTRTNAPGFRGTESGMQDVELDLAAPVPADLQQSWDVVLNHTTLEHIFEIRTAFANLCAIGKDAVILIVPFAQHVHQKDDLKDYWRLTPECIRALFAENGFGVVYESANDEPNAATYLLIIGSRTPEAWSGKLPPWQPVEHLGDWIGAPPRGLFTRLLDWLCGG